MRKNEVQKKALQSQNFIKISDGFFLIEKLLKQIKIH